MNFNNIKKYREEKNMTLKELSKLSNCSTGYVCHLEKGSRQNPSIDIMENISKALNKSIVEIFFDNR